MDDLKKWVNENREDWEVYHTDYDPLWADIEKRIDRENKKAVKRMLIRVMKVAATVVVLSLIGLYALLYNQGYDHSAGFALHEVSPEMAETEFYYSSMVNEKMERIKMSGVEISPDVFGELSSLDSAYQDLMKDLNDGAGSEEVVEAMVQNYRIKLFILEKILEELNNEEDENTEHNEVVL